MQFWRSINFHVFLRTKVVLYHLIQVEIMKLTSFVLAKDVAPTPTTSTWPISTQASLAQACSSRARLDDAIVAQRFRTAARRLTRKNKARIGPNLAKDGDRDRSWPLDVV